MCRGHAFNWLAQSLPTTSDMVDMHCGVRVCSGLRHVQRKIWEKFPPTCLIAFHYARMWQRTTRQSFEARAQDLLEETSSPDSSVAQIWKPANGLRRRAHPTMGADVIPAIEEYITTLPGIGLRRHLTLAQFATALVCLDGLPVVTAKHVDLAAGLLGLHSARETSRVDSNDQNVSGAEASDLPEPSSKQDSLTESRKPSH